MITAYEVGAVFKILDEASPALRKMLATVRELNKAIDATKANIAGLAKMPALDAAIGETKALAGAWGDVAKASAAANGAIGRATRSAAALAVPGSAAAVAQTQQLAAAYGGNRGLFRPGARGGGGVALATGTSRLHFGGPGIGLPGGAHVRFGGPSMAAAATFGWGIDQAAKTEDYVWRLEDTAQLPHDEPTHAKFRKLLQDFQIRAGYDIDQAGKAALANIRQFQATPGGGVDTLDEILSAGAVEARRKGASLEESVESGIGLAHQFQAYSPPEIKKLMATFAALSTADPRSLTSMKRAAGYAVPTLRELGVDPTSVLLAGTALARAGVDSTRSGTWTREAMARAIGGGAVIGHRFANRKAHEALLAMGLIDEKGKPLFLSGEGNPDMYKFLELSGRAMAGMTPQQRAIYGRNAFGAQGQGFVSVASDPVVQQQIGSLRDLVGSKAYLDRYNSFGKDYEAGSSLQNFRTAVADFNVTTGEIARGALPAVNRELGEFKSILDGIRSIIPHAPNPATGDKGTPDLMGQAATGVMGVAKGFMEQLEKLNNGTTLGFDRAGTYTSPGKTGKPAEKIVVTPPITLNLNVDGRTLAQVIGDKLAEFGRYQTDTPAANGTTVFGP